MDENEIVEITNDENGMNSENNTANSLLAVKPKEELPRKNKKSFKDKWNNLPKKKKIIIITIVSVVLLAIILVVLYLFVFKKEEKPIAKEETVIIEKDNYRYENGTLVFLDKNDRDIGKYECNTKDDKKCYVTKVDYTKDKFERIMSVTEDGKEIEKSSGIYYDYVFVTDDDETFLYNYKTNKKELDVDLIKSYGTEKNLIVVEENDKYGLIEIKEDGYDYLIRPLYDYLGIVNTKLVYLVAKDKEETYIVDSGGKKLSKNISEDIMSVNKDYIVTKNNKSYSLYNFENDELISNYDYIGLHDDVISLVKSNHLYLKDSGLNKLYQDGIRLENNDYVKKYVYDSNKALKETKKAYEISMKDNELLLTIGDEVKNINILEGKVSSKYSLISYFDGKLYFYNDTDKDDVIGTYTCNNKNTITSDSLLSNCTIYSKDNLYSSIYNDNYVIIIDTSSLDNVIYYLYSLKDKKVKGNYSSVEIVKKDELSEQIKKVYTDESYIIAKASNGNSKDNLGVLLIDSTKVTGKGGFKFSKIEAKNSYYLMTNAVDKKYSVYDSKFNPISNSFDYIELFDKYYVGITNKTLNVYSYSSNNGILENDLNVLNNDFKVEFNSGIKITIGTDVYEYDSNGKMIKNNPETQDKPNTENSGDSTDEG